MEKPIQIQNGVIQLLAQVRDRQLRLAQKGEIDESGHYAWLAQRLNRWLERTSGSPSTKPAYL